METQRIGAYRIIEELGNGGMGIVFRGEDTRGGEPVAIKSLHSGVVDRTLIERFRREGETLRQLNHPNIVKMLDTVEADGKQYLVMELVGGGSLKDELDQQPGRKLPIPRTLDITLDLSDALTRAHRLDIIHRDLKPANVLIAADGTPRLSDFGIARVEGSRATESGVVTGTFAYLPPESFSAGKANALFDIWSFGVVLFEMLAGRVPFEGQTLAALLNTILREPVPDLEKLRPDAPVGLVDLVYRMLEKDPARRIPSVRLVGAELESLLRSDSPSIPSAGKVLPSAPQDLTPDPLTTRMVRHNLPVQTTAFVGREAELETLASLIADTDKRLITIHAPGGMGKTRLALEVAGRVVDPHGDSPVPSQQTWKDGVYLVELAPLSDPGNIVSAIAEATSYPFQSDGRDSRQQILDFLKEKQMLLILDNFEHLLEGVSLITDILQAASAVKVLVTTRQRLSLTAETIFNLGGMEFPEGQAADGDYSYSAVNLFMLCARRLKPDFDLSDNRGKHVTRICQLVQGVPLGIMLAASWLEMLSPEEIAHEIQQNLNFLEAQMIDLPERQRSLRAVYDYSWNLMGEAEQQVFRRLSVFRGGFRREAAEQIAGADLRSLMSLHNRSLLHRDSVSGRYSIHELLRQYAEEQLTFSEGEGRIQEAHAIYYADFTREREIDIQGRAQIKGLNELEADIENVRVAWKWAVEHRRDDLLDRMLEGLKLLCEMRNRYEDRQAFFVRTREVFFPQVGDEPPPLWCRMIVRHAGFMSHQGDVRPEFQKCLAMARQRGDAAEAAYCLYALADANATMRDVRAIPLYEESLQAYQELGETFYMTQIVNRLGAIHLFTGKEDIALEFGQRGIAYGRESGNRIDTGWSIHTVAGHYMWIGELSQAVRYFQEASTIWREAGNQEGLATALFNIAYDYLRQSKIDEAHKLAEESLAIARHINNEMRVGCALSVLSAVAIWKGDYDTGLSLAQEAASPLERMPPIRATNFSNFTAAALGQGDYARAAESIREAIPYINRVNPRWHVITIGLAALLFARQREHDKAAELWGACHNAGSLSYFVSWPPLVGLPDELKAELGAGAYHAAWERGSMLKLDAVVAELL